MLTLLSELATLAERVSPLALPDTHPALVMAPGMSDAGLLAMLSPETLILALAALLFTGCILLGLEIRAEYRDN